MGGSHCAQGNLLAWLGLVNVESHLRCASEDISLLPGPSELTVIRLVETHFSKHLGNQFYDLHFKHI